MSRIVVILRGELEVPALWKLHKILGAPLSETRSVLAEGAPIINMELFDGGYEEKSGLLRKIIELIRESKTTCDIYEIPSGDTFSSINSPLDSLISLDVLENILTMSDREMDRQLDME